MAKKKNVKKTEKKKIRQKWETQVIVIVGFMLIVLATVFIFYWISVNSKKFEFAGLKFEKIKEGSLTFYNTNFPLKDIFGNTVSYLPAYFREDPRKLANITIDGAIKLKSTVALAADSDILRCEDSILAGTTLSVFLAKAGISSFGATTNKTEAEYFNRTYVDCGNTSQYSIVMFKNSTVDRIDELLSPNCYVISIANCNFMNVTERFMMGVYAHSAGISI